MCKILLKAKSKLDHREMKTKPLLTHSIQGRSTNCGRKGINTSRHPFRDTSFAVDSLYGKPERTPRNCPCYPNLVVSQFNVTAFPEHGNRELTIMHDVCVNQKFVLQGICRTWYRVQDELNANHLT